MLAHVALPDTRPSWASNPGSMPKDRFWPNPEVVEGPLSDTRRVGTGRSRAYSVRYWGAILAGVTVRCAVTRQSHAQPLPPV